MRYSKKKAALVTGPIGWSDYAACLGTGLGQENGGFCDAESALPFGVSLSQRIDCWKSRVRLQDITDGTSNTVTYGEKFVTDFPNDPSIFNGGSGHGYGRYLSELLVPVPSDATLSEYPGKEISFGGPHEGVCMFSYADGHVEAISLTVDGSVLCALSTIAGGEVISTGR
ncbi:DUF1559 family PulG-like putative transporter [Calycomorphotria hydatis]|uniref:DUF1559 domain-containing protein n=1 Tax=Calycomorphotria hydatis TaxID=2528027 RepID=A0A517T6T9_9PLAN|nr:DUF1559 domain-containing protein [Calycomorphotria hydatis]QDT64089.1 hypothetical protein V22_13200 [Calycomorphotria hydatis]